MWRDGLARTTPGETAAAVRAGELVPARDRGLLAGCVRVAMLDGQTGWFGALAVDPPHARRGVGGALVRFAEQQARSGSATAMQLELLVPAGEHAQKHLLAAWYGRLGYEEVARRDVAETHPEAAPFLTGPAHVAVMRKPL